MNLWPWLLQTVTSIATKSLSCYKESPLIDWLIDIKDRWPPFQDEGVEMDWYTCSSLSCLTSLFPRSLLLLQSRITPGRKIYIYIYIWLYCQEIYGRCFFEQLGSEWRLESSKLCYSIQTCWIMAIAQVMPLRLLKWSLSTPCIRFRL